MQMEKESHYHDRDTQEFLADVGAVLPWHRLWTRTFLGQLRPDELDQAIEEVRFGSSVGLLTSIIGMIASYRKKFQESGLKSYSWLIPQRREWTGLLHGRDRSNKNYLLQH